jgi:radical SAM superfamily enzyme
MPTDDLAQICTYARSLFPLLKRITVYGSSRYIHKKGLADLVKLEKSGLSRIHVGLESGDDEVLRRIKKGTNGAEQVEAGLWVREAGIELSEYIILGIGGKERTEAHALETARALNLINPHFIRLRTLLPKVNTLLLHQFRKGQFQMLSAHEVLTETRQIIENLDVTSMIHSDHYTNYVNVSMIHSDHYTNYVNVHGRMPEDKERMLQVIDEALEEDESEFRAVYVGTQ